jgi:hypothetical protein
MSATAESVQIKAPRKVQLAANCFKLSEYVSNRFEALCDSATIEAEVLQESYWAHVASQLKPNDIIIATPNDRSFWAELLVNGAGRLWADVQVLRWIERGEVRVSVKEKSDYRVEWSGGHGKWRVVRGQDVVKEGFDTEKDANKWVDSHTEALLR